MSTQLYEKKRCKKLRRNLKIVVPIQAKIEAICLKEPRILSGSISSLNRMVSELSEGPEFVKGSFWALNVN